MSYATTPITIQIGFDLPDPNAPLYRFTELIDEHYANATEEEKPYIRMALDVLSSTHFDLREGMTLISSVVDDGAPLTFGGGGRVLCNLMDATDWMNESDDEGLCLWHVSVFLGVGMKTLRRVMATILDVDLTSDDRAFFKLPADFKLAVELMQDRPPKRRKTPKPKAPRALVADEPQFAKQPLLSAVVAKWAKKSAPLRLQKALDYENEEFNAPAWDFRGAK